MYVWYVWCGVHEVWFCVRVGGRDGVCVCVCVFVCLSVCLCVWCVVCFSWLRNLHSSSSSPSPPNCVFFFDLLQSIKANSFPQMYSWVPGLPLGKGHLTRGHTHRAELTSLPAPALTNPLISSAVGRLLNSSSILGLGMMWACMELVLPCSFLFSSHSLLQPF